MLSYDSPGSLRAQDLPYDSNGSTYDAIFSTHRATYTLNNTFSAGDIVYRTSDGWALSQANAEANAEVHGVIEIATATAFTVVFPGGLLEVEDSLTPGQTYFLSTEIAGGATTVPPTAVGTVSKPVLVVVSEHTVRILGARGMVNVEAITTVTGATGPQGPQGAAGSGATGPQGDAGAQGATGATGSNGSDGPQGYQGGPGSQGPQGSQGNAGTVGPTGPQGATGSTGATGTIGPQGSQGIRGYQGAQGSQGYIGPQGSQGTQGTQGPQGTQGSVLFQSPPASYDSTGTQGTQIYSDGYMYVCVATNAWVRMPAASVW